MSKNHPLRVEEFLKYIALHHGSADRLHVEMAEDGGVDVNKLPL